MKFKRLWYGATVLTGVVMGLLGCDVVSKPATSGTTSAPDEDLNSPAIGTPHSGSPSTAAKTQ